MKNVAGVLSNVNFNLIWHELLIKEIMLLEVLMKSFNKLGKILLFKTKKLNNELKCWNLINYTIIKISKHEETVLIKSKLCCNKIVMFQFSYNSHKHFNIIHQFFILYLNIFLVVHFWFEKGYLTRKNVYFDMRQKGFLKSKHRFVNWTMIWFVSELFL